MSAQSRESAAETPQPTDVTVFDEPATADIVTRLGVSEANAMAWQSDAGRAALRRIKRNTTRRIVNAIGGRVTAMVRPPDKPQMHSKEHYEEVFSIDGTGDRVRAYLVNYPTSAKPQIYRIRRDCLVETNARAVHKLVDDTRLRIISALKPTSICEIGSGNGRNLVTIANAFPDIALTGYELTENGTQFARLLQRQHLPATAFGRHFGIKPESQAAIHRINFQLGSAFDLPCADDAFDMTITSAAISCMSKDAARALREIHRVTRKYVVLYEPFRDVNDGLDNVFLKVNKRFDLSVSQVEKLGFETMAVLDYLPVQPSHAYGMLVARVV